MIQRLTQSQTFDAGKLRMAAEQKKDESILLHIRDKDCVAVEACYHKKCYTSYTNFLNYKLVEDKEERLYEESYQKFCKQVVDKKIITDREVMLMTKLFDCFVKYVQDTEALDASNYRRFRLKKRLKLTYPQLVFHKPSKRNMSELVFCEDLSAGVIAGEHISMCNSSDTETSSQEEREIPSTSTMKSGNNEEEDMRTLFHAAMILRGKIKECDNFYQKWPPTPSEFTTTNAEQMIPPSLSVFLSWLLGFSSTVNMNSYLGIPENQYLKVLSLAQDIIHVSSNGRKQTPKSLSLGMAVRQITGSYALTKVLNGFGNSVSHSAVLSLDTAFASQCLDNDTVIPEGIIPRKFTMMVWDNIDFLEETPTGAGSTHMANGIVIQHTRDDQQLPKQRKTSTTTIKKSLRSLKAPEKQLHTYILGNKESPKLHSATINSELETSLVTQKNSLDRSLMLDFIYTICKYYCDELSTILPGWTGFNTLISEKPDGISKVGYLPVVDAPVTDISTIYTILRRSVDIANKLELQYAVLIFDEAVYAKTQQVRWKSDEFLNKFIFRLGEFHACMSYATAISCRFRSAGLQVSIFNILVFPFTVHRNITHIE